MNDWKGYKKGGNDKRETDNDDKKLSTVDWIYGLSMLVFVVCGIIFLGLLAVEHLTGDDDPEPEKYAKVRADYFVNETYWVKAVGYHDKYCKPSPGFCDHPNRLMLSVHEAGNYTLTVRNNSVPVEVTDDMFDVTITWERRAVVWLDLALSRISLAELTIEYNGNLETHEV